MTNPLLTALQAISQAHTDTDQLAGDLHRRRTDLITQAKQQGLPATKIAQAAGISRARLYQILQETQ